MSPTRLFRPFRLGPLSLANRFVMAPMTRGRNDARGVPQPMAARHYADRASAGLIVTEATAISPTAVGWLGAPGIWSDEQIAGWRPVTSAVHARGGKVFVQLWHMGRVSHPDFLGGALPVGPSAIAAQGETHTAGGKKPYVTPRALDLAEIPRIVQEYAAATARARAAGFDGVELHAANGYLIDQFLRDRTNQRTDRYGGSVANRARFLLEVAEACAGAWSADRVGVRLSPSGAYNDMADSNPVRTFEHAARSLGRLGLAYLHVTEPGKGHPMHVDLPPQAGPMRRAFGGPFVLNHGGDAAAGEQALAEGRADLIAFGTAFLANPDFVRRTRLGQPLNAPDWATLYTPGEKGYNDYPTLA